MWLFSLHEYIFLYYVTWSRNANRYQPIRLKNFDINFLKHFEDYKFDRSWVFLCYEMSNGIKDQANRHTRPERVKKEFLFM